MLHSYLTVKETGEHEIVIEKSRFICHLSRAASEEEAQEFIQKIKKQHWNATHNCSAYLIGETDHIQKANDDGEPSGTADSTNGTAGANGTDSTQSGGTTGY